MDKILAGVGYFTNVDYPDNASYFQRLAEKQQRPLALFITCSDSRILPNRITNTEPGELFQVRNAGNIVPPYSGRGGGEAATIEYSVEVLGIRHIIVCGHSQCGAMSAMLNSLTSPVLANLPGVKEWFSYAEATRQIVRHKYQNLSGPELARAATEENVLVQMNHLSTHPCVAARLAKNELHVYGWYYDIGGGRVLQYDQSSGRFADLGNTAMPAQPMPVRQLEEAPDVNTIA